MCAIASLISVRRILPERMVSSQTNHTPIIAHCVAKHPDLRNILLLHWALWVHLSSIDLTDCTNGVVIKFSLYELVPGDTECEETYLQQRKRVRSHHSR